jgi:hypothetical protein
MNNIATTPMVPNTTTLMVPNTTTLLEVVETIEAKEIVHNTFGVEVIDTRM